VTAIGSSTLISELVGYAVSAVVFSFIIVGAVVGEYVGASDDSMSPAGAEVGYLLPSLSTLSPLSLVVFSSGPLFSVGSVVIVIDT